MPAGVICGQRLAPKPADKAHQKLDKKNKAKRAHTKDRISNLPGTPAAKPLPRKQ